MKKNGLLLKHQYSIGKIAIFRRGKIQRRPKELSGCVLQANKKLKNRYRGLRESEKMMILDQTSDFMKNCDLHC